MNTEISTRVSTLFGAALLGAAIVTSLTAQTALERHNPYTVDGMQLRTNLITPSLPVQAQESNRALSSTVIPTLFQEIVPCRFISTLADDHYPQPWGGGAFQPNERRTYKPTGTLVEATFTNPCSERVPSDAVAVSMRITSRGPLGAGIMWLAGGDVTAFGAQPALPFVQQVDAMDEANVLLVDHRFGLMSSDSATDLTVDIIGYFIADPNARGEKGDRGEKGAVGAQGPKGDKGDQGLAGVAGAQGEKGDRGETGAVGAQGSKGDKGDQGIAGVAGAQGEKGDRGETGAVGAQGPKGDKGDQGIAGVAGAQGDKGDRGETGAVGAQGAKGDKGDKGDRGDVGATGAQGLKGDKGDQGIAGVAGAQGLKGDKGDRGETGATGAQGLQGPKGDKGDKGLQGIQGPIGPQGPQGPIPAFINAGSCVYVFPPGGRLTIHDANVKSASFIIPVYTEISNGNALGIESVRNGSFVATGSPNKPFKYLVVTPN